MTALTLRIDTDPTRIPTAVYEWDRQYRHLIHLDVRDCGDHLEIVGTPYGAIENVVARWHESWREAFECGHSTVAWETGIEPLPLDKKVYVSVERIVEHEALLKGNGRTASGELVPVNGVAHVVTRTESEERVTVRHADAWQPAGEYDGFYDDPTDPTIELPVVAPDPVLPEAIDTAYQRGVGEYASAKLSSAVPASAFLTAVYDWERHGALMVEPSYTRPAWQPVGSDENAIVHAYVGDLDVCGEAPTDKKPKGNEYAFPCTMRAAQELGLTDMSAADTFRLFVAALVMERDGEPDLNPEQEFVGGKLVATRKNDGWAWSLGGKVAGKFASDPRAFLVWVRQNRDRLVPASFEVIEPKPKAARAPAAVAATAISAFVSNPLVTQFDTLPMFVGIKFQGGHTLASQALLADNGGDIRKTLTEMQEAISQNQETNR